MTNTITNKIYSELLYPSIGIQNSIRFGNLSGLNIRKIKTLPSFKNFLTISLTILY